MLSDLRTDVLIIGAGVIGLSLAYELSRRDVSVRIVDRAEPGREASWAGAGILPPANEQTSHHPLDRLRGLSHRLHAEWAERLLDETGIDTGYRRCGGIYVARTAGEAAALLALASEYDELEIACERLGLAQIDELEPALTESVRSSSWKAALLLPDECQLRNPWHLQALAQACVKRGVVITPHAEVVDWHRGSSGEITAAVTPAGVFAADRFCVTAGAWSYRILEQLGVKTGIYPIRGQMILFDCGKRPFQRIINEGSRYLVPRDDGLVLAGSTEEEAGFAKENTREGVEDLKQFAYSLIPRLAQERILKSWSGLRPGSFDGLPYLGPVLGHERLYLAAGHFRSGLHLSPGTAVVMTQAILGELPSIDLTPFSLIRG